MKKIYNFFLRIETLNRAAFVMMLSVFFVGQVLGEIYTFSGSNLNIISDSKTVGDVTLSNVTMNSYSSSGLVASSSGQTFTLTASGTTITEIVITTTSPSARYKKTKITDCTSCIQSGNVYTCAINNATTVSCTTDGGGVTVTQIDVTVQPSWKLTGDFNSWGETSMESTIGGGSVKIDLEANQRYQFKFKKNTDFYGNTGAIVSNISGWVFSTDKDNCTLYTGPAGKYTFELNTTTKEVAVTYPSVSHPDPNYVYFIPGTGWSSARIYNWKEGSYPTEEASSWEGAPTITTQTNICGQDYYYCAAYFDHVKFRDDDSNETKDLTLVRGQYKDERDHDAGFTPFATYTISFNSGSGEGTMSAISGICAGADQLIPTNGFTKSGYIFNYWTADQDVTVGGSVIATGAAIQAGATIENVGADITLTAQWRVKPAMFQYILGSCQVENGVWKQGKDGSVGAWRYKTEDGNLLATTDIEYEASAATIYFNSKDLSQLDDDTKWGTSQTGNRAIKALKVDHDQTVTFNLKSLTAYKITFYVFPGSNDAYSIDLTVNSVLENKSIPTGQQNKWHKYEYDGGIYTGNFSIHSSGKDSYVVVIVETPAVKISFDANSGTGTMASMLVNEGDEVQLPKNVFTRTNYRFGGWTEDAGGTGTMIDDEGLYATSADVTLYAQWEEIILTTITLDASDASNSYTSSVVAAHNEAMPEIPVLPIRAGYVFDGYYDAAGGAGTKYYSGLGNSLRKWDKTDPTCTLYANWKTPCDIEPTLTNIMPIVTIWDQKDVEIGIVKLHCDFDISGITYSLQSVSPANPIEGCHFEYFDEKIHLIGKPNLNNASTETVNVTFTIRNSCSTASTYEITTPIRIYPKNQKAKVAFIVTGTEKSSIAAGGNFNAYTADDKTACNDLLTYLSGYYDVTCVNGYATKDTTEIANYYKDYDLLVVTDFLNTSKGYTNAIGTLIDKKPILSFEAYVANLSNWHIQSNPTDPSPKVKRMYVLCNGHAIFKKEGSVDIVDAKDSVTVLSALSSAGSAKGLQGFVINEAPDFLFIATVKDAANNRDLVVCCERQKVFPARLMLFGVNFYEMANLSDAGRIIIRQMMDYLLLTDEKEVSDCSLVFDNGKDGAETGSGDGKWSNPNNWWPTYSRVPTQFQPTRIIRPCTVDQEDAHAGSVKINVGEDHSHNPYTGKITIEPTGGLTVAGAINKVKDTRWATLLETDEEDIEIRSNEDHNGALVFGNKETNVRATVQYYSRAFGAPTTPTWQYIGIPTQAGQTAIEMYYAAWMCRWESSGTLGGLWQWVANEDVLQPFEGYCITQAAAKTYTLTGNLNEPKERTLALDIRDGDGFAFAANSWTAPIKISQMQDDDFTNAEKSIYIYHTGTYAEWEAKKDEIINTKTSGSTVLPGQYTVIPIHSSPYIGVDSVIPAMQGFFVKTTDTGAKLKLVYNRVVYDSKYFKTSTQPMRAPSRTMELSDAPEVMVLTVVGDSLGADRVHILSRGDFSQSYEDGWDGRKVEGDAIAPKLSVVKDCGEMAVAAIETPEGQYLSFRAGEDSIYTFTFDYEGETIYLYDRLADEAAEIRTGNTYTFRATNKTAAERFLITATPPRTPTQIETIGAEPRAEKAEKIIHENKLMILYHGAVYDAQGARVMIGKEGAR